MGNSASPSCSPMWLGASTPCLAYENIILFPSHPSSAGGHSHAEMQPPLGGQSCFQGLTQCGDAEVCREQGLVRVPGSIPGSGGERNTACPGRQNCRQPGVMLCSWTITDRHAVTFSSKAILGAGRPVSAGVGWAGEECRRLLCWQPAGQRVRQSRLLC